MKISSENLEDEVKAVLVGEVSSSLFGVDEVSALIQIHLDLLEQSMCKIGRIWVFEVGHQMLFNLACAFSLCLNFIQRNIK